MPDRREFLQSAFPGALAGAAGTAGAQTSAPNVLLIMADQLRADALGAYGNPVIRTPHIDGLARGGTVFTRHFTPHPVCMPSRASIFTGRYPGAHGVRTNGVRLSEKEVTMAEVFRRSGYRTGGAGKFHFIPHILNVFPSMEKNSGPYYGFEDYHIGEDGHRGEIEHWLNRKGPGFFKTPDHLLPLELHPSTWVAGHTTRFIRECAGQGKPFFAFASFVDPHQAYDPPPPYRDMYRESDMPQPVFRAGEHDLRPPFYNTILGRFDRLNQRPLYNRAQYYGEVSLIDDCVGRILATLDELKIRDNTLIVFTSDHGDLLGDHRYWFKGFYHFHQCTRTPLIFHWAGRVKAGKKVEGMAQAIDIFPTVMELAGLKNPPGVQGRSQAKVAAGGETGTGWPSALIEFLFRGVEAPGAQDDWQTHELCTLVTPEWRMSHYPGMAFGELYDLTADPNELSNVWGQPKYEAVRRRLRDELLDRVMQAHDPLPVRETMY